MKLVTEQGYSIAEAARNLGVNANLLGRWKKEAGLPDGETTAPGNTAAMQAELKRLRKENKQLKMERERLIPKVKVIHERVRGSYGARRISAELTAAGEPCGRTKAATLMQLANISANQKKKYKATIDSKHKLSVAQNLLERNFTVSQADSIYCSDITYLWTAEGWLYLAVVIDLYSRRIVGWSLNSRMIKKLVINALQMAIWRRRPLSGLIFLLDRGSQYCSHDFQKLLKKNQMKSSMSRKGDCWDTQCC